MADLTVVDSPPPPPPQNQTLPADYDGLPIPPLDPTYFNQTESEAFLNFNPLDQDDVVFEDLDFDLDFSFDDLLPASLGPEPLPNPDHFDSGCFALPGSGPNLPQFPPDRSLKNAFKTTSLEFSEFRAENVEGDDAIMNSSLSSPEPEVYQVSSGQSSGSDRISGHRGADITGYLNVPSPESNGSKGSNDSRVLNCPSPESQGSGNSGSQVSDNSNNSVNSSPNFGNNVMKNAVIAQKIKLEEMNSSKNSSLLKRKIEGEDSNNSDSRTNKFQKSNTLSNDVGDTNNNVISSEGEEKKRARLMRNRESAQLSRQRKKHYVEELEDKVRNMGSTIQDLNVQIAYIMAENAGLRQQLSGGRVPPPPMAPPPPGMYPSQMMYPWMPCGVPPYMVKSQGSQVPLVPIPRLKPQQPVSAPKPNKKAESKKSEGKTKKVASVSFLGLMFFILLFGGLVPTLNVRYGGMKEVFTGGSDYIGSQFYEKHHGRVLVVDGNMSGTDYGEKFGGGRDFADHRHHARSHGGVGERNMEHGMDENIHLRNGSEPLAASLYVPRNDKLVKIDGNLIIHSVLASEKAMASREDPAKKATGETRLAVPGDFSPAVPVSGGRTSHLHRNPSERQRALGSSSMKDTLKSTPADGRLQQWFREGLAGPMLSSGMCTEVFQFDVSSAIVPATSTRNISGDQHQNSTHVNKGKNRRILRGLPVPLPGSSHNISDDQAGDSQKENFNGNNSLSSMVVSVLVDPREVDDVDVNGVMGAKSLSRIFVVVLIDSVKYVTYSCMLPFMGASPHLVTT